MTKAQLRAYKDLRQERDYLAQMIEDIEAVMYGPRAVRMDGMPRGGSGSTGGPTAELATRHLDLVQQYTEKVTLLTERLAEIEQAIEVLEPRERTLIRLHYIEGMVWEEVCIKMSYSWRQVHRIHAKALEQLKMA
jgi:RNA polymerase sigma factor (sigma-70 family)